MDEQLIDYCYRKLNSGYMCLMCAITLFLIVLWGPYLTGIFAYIILSVVLAIHIAGFFIVRNKIPYTTVKVLMSTYFIVVTILLYPMMAVLGKLGQVSFHIWFLVSPFHLLLYYSRKETMYWCLYIFVLIVSSFFVFDFAGFLLNIDNGGLQYFHTLDKAAEEAIVWRGKYNNLSTLVCIFGIHVYFLYYGEQIRKIRYSSFTATSLPAEQSKAKNNEANNMVYNEEKLNALYSDIVRYFEENKPYIQADFTVTQMVIALNSNITYISKAIKQNTKMNFASFVNTYRIEQVKTMLAEHSNKYTLRHIYQSCGFQNQSTFNKTFKTIEGVTPSEYCKAKNLQVLT